MPRKPETKEDENNPGSQGEVGPNVTEPSSTEVEVQKKIKKGGKLLTKIDSAIKELEGSQKGEAKKDEGGVEREPKKPLSLAEISDILKATKDLTEFSEEKDKIDLIADKLHDYISSGGEFPKSDEEQKHLDQIVQIYKELGIDFDGKDVKEDDLRVAIKDKFFTRPEGTPEAGRSPESLTEGRDEVSDSATGKSKDVEPEASRVLKPRPKKWIRVEPGQIPYVTSGVKEDKGEPAPKSESKDTAKKPDTGAQQEGEPVVETRLEPQKDGGEPTTQQEGVATPELTQSQAAQALDSMQSERIEGDKEKIVLETLLNSLKGTSFFTSNIARLTPEKLGSKLTTARDELNDAVSRNKGVRKMTLKESQEKLQDIEKYLEELKAKAGVAPEDNADTVREKVDGVLQTIIDGAIANEFKSAKGIKNFLAGTLDMRTKREKFFMEADEEKLGTLARWITDQRNILRGDKEKHKKITPSKQRMIKFLEKIHKEVFSVAKGKKMPKEEFEGMVRERIKELFFTEEGDKKLVALFSEKIEMEAPKPQEPTETKRETPFPETGKKAEKEPVVPDRENLLEKLNNASEEEKGRIIKKLEKGRSVHSFLKGFKVKRRDGKEEIIKGLHYVNFENIEETKDGLKGTLVLYNEAGEQVFKSRKGAYDMGRAGLREGKKLVPTATEMETGNTVLFRDNTTGEFERSLVTSSQQGERMDYHFVNEETNKSSSVPGNELVKYGNNVYAQRLIKPEKEIKSEGKTPLREEQTLEEFFGSDILGVKNKEKARASKEQEPVKAELVDEKLDRTQKEADAEYYLEKFLPDSVPDYEKLKEDRGRYERLLESAKERQMVEGKGEFKKLNKLIKNYEKQIYSLDWEIEKFERKARWAKEDYLNSPQYYKDRMGNLKKAAEEAEQKGEQGKFDRLQSQIDRLEEKVNPSLWKRALSFNWRGARHIKKGIKYLSRRFPTATSLGGIAGTAGLFAIGGPVTLIGSVPLAGYGLYRSIKEGSAREDGDERWWLNSLGKGLGWQQKEYYFKGKEKVKASDKKARSEKEIPTKKISKQESTKRLPQDTGNIALEAIRETSDINLEPPKEVPDIEPELPKEVPDIPLERVEEEREKGSASETSDTTKSQIIELNNGIIFTREIYEELKKKGYDPDRAEKKIMGFSGYASEKVEIPLAKDANRKVAISVEATTSKQKIMDEINSSKAQKSGRKLGFK